MAIIDIKKALQNYGLDNKEISIYLAVLRLGSATILEIAKITKIKRTTLYLATERLLERGVLGQYKVKYGTHFVATSPKSLLVKLDDIKASVESIVPELEAIEKKELFEPSVQFFRGKEGYLRVVNDSLDGYSHEVLYIGSENLVNEVISERYITEKYIPTRLQRKIKFRQLMAKEPFTLKLKELAEKELRQVKFLPEDFICSSNMLIYKDKVAYFSSRRELTTVLIESPDIAEMEKKKFNLLWSRL